MATKRAAKIVYTVTIGTESDYQTVRVPAYTRRGLSDYVVYSAAAKATGRNLAECTRRQIDGIDRIYQ